MSALFQYSIVFCIFLLIKNIVSYDSTQLKFKKYESSLSGNIYYFTKQSTKLWSLSEAMGKCPYGSRLLTIQTKAIANDMKEIQKELDGGRVILAMANKRNVNSWIFNDKLYSGVYNTNWEGRNYTMSSEECAYINVRHNMKWGMSSCIDHYKLVCIQDLKEKCPPIWMNSTGEKVMHDHAVPGKQAQTLEQCLQLCQFIDDHCIGIYASSPFFFDCWLIMSLSIEPSFKTTLYYYMKHPDKKCFDHITATVRQKSVKSIPRTKDTKTSHKNLLRTKRQLFDDSDDIDVILEVITPFNGTVDPNNQKKSCTEAIYISSLILCCGYGLGILSFRGIIFLIHYLRDRSTQKDEANIAKKQEEMAAKMGDDEAKDEE